MFRITENGIAEADMELPNGFLNGYGVFEIIKLIFDQDKGIIRAENLAEHYRRLVAGAEALSLKSDFTFYRLEMAISYLIKTKRLRSGFLKVYVLETTFPVAEAYILYSPYVVPDELYTKGYKIKISRYRINSNAPTAAFNVMSNINRIWALNRVKAEGADEVLFLNTDNYIAECAEANIFWQNKSVIYTPDIHAGIVAGVARQKVIDRYRARGYIIKEGMYELNDLYLADRIFIVNSLLNEMPVQLIH